MKNDDSCNSNIKHDQSGEFEICDFSGESASSLQPDQNEADNSYNKQENPSLLPVIKNNDSKKSDFEQDQSNEPIINDIDNDNERSKNQYKNFYIKSFEDIRECINEDELLIPFELIENTIFDRCQIQYLDFISFIYVKNTVTERSLCLIINDLLQKEDDRSNNSSIIMNLSEKIDVINDIINLNEKEKQSADLWNMIITEITEICTFLDINHRKNQLNLNLNCNEIDLYLFLICSIIHQTKIYANSSFQIGMLFKNITYVEDLKDLQTEYDNIYAKIQRIEQFIDHFFFLKNSEFIVIPKNVIEYAKLKKFLFLHVLQAQILRVLFEEKDVHNEPLKVNRTRAIIDLNKNLNDYLIFFSCNISIRLTTIEPKYGFLENENRGRRVKEYKFCFYIYILAETRKILTTIDAFFPC